MKKIYFLTFFIFVANFLFASKVIILEDDGNFDNGISAWETVVNDDNTLTIDNSGKISGANSVLFNIGNSNVDSTDLQLSYIFTAIKGATYKLRFKAMADVETSIFVALVQDREPYNAVLKETIVLSNEIATFQFFSDEVPFSEGLFRRGSDDP